MSTQQNDVIVNYGLYWERHKVNWWPGRGGRGNRRIRLLGKEYGIGRAHDENDDENAVDFANQNGIYLLHNGFETVYVGQTTNNRDGLFQRLRIHCSEPSKGPMWDKFSWFGFKQVAQIDVTQTNGIYRELANDHLEIDKPTVSMRTLIKVVETIVIQATLPRLNGQSGQFLGVPFLQVRDSALTRSRQTESELPPVEEPV